MQELLEKLIEKHKPVCNKGKIPDYIPILREQDPFGLGITVVTTDKKIVSAGDCPTRFTLQSISKVIALILSIMDNGEEAVFAKVGMEPTGDPFNSIYKMEVFSYSKPLNPMINAGAMVVSSLINGKTVSEKLERLLKLVRDMAENDQIQIEEEVFRSEWEQAHRNRALAHFLKELDLIYDVEDALAVYLRQCAIGVDCTDLAKIGLCLAQNGRSYSGKQLFSRHVARLAKTFMVTCGMYNASGEFAIRVGIPAKSGVSGGILASVPDRMGIGVIGPALDEKGNSIGGIAILEDLSCEWNLSIF
ncbi:glutaminase A [Paenactinomyces guangxiensis]|uniref:Glutaminase n=1 Tax=Paenactinomyces guangxiensis TaxID=1490290 RepID=A0A7W1WN05_9BACL|nr:glutaminase A [Paenactinomyces guangxiensis]MBA4492879.1 glutaminase A [Paenactinomyces guangxiensis]MBH8590273.1 glutaminase A [Paenactinomyces guangxiensis]